MAQFIYKGQETFNRLITSLVDAHVYDQQYAYVLPYTPAKAITIVENLLGVVAQDIVTIYINGTAVAQAKVVDNTGLIYADLYLPLGVLTLEIKTATPTPTLLQAQQFRTLNLYLYMQIFGALFKDYRSEISQIATDLNFWTVRDNQIYPNFGYLYDFAPTFFWDLPTYRKVLLGGKLQIGAASVSNVVATLNVGGTLAVGTPYYYVVTALNAKGETFQSAEVTATPTLGNQTIQLSWTVISNATAYNIYRTVTSGIYSTDSLVGQVLTGTFTDAGVTASAGQPPRWGIKTAYTHQSTVQGIIDVVRAFGGILLDPVENLLAQLRWRIHSQRDTATRQIIRSSSLPQDTLNTIAQVALPFGVGQVGRTWKLIDQNGIPYQEGVDYTVVDNLDTSISIDWSLASTEPATGITYTVFYGSLDRIQKYATTLTKGVAGGQDILITIPQKAAGQDVSRIYVADQFGNTYIEEVDFKFVRNLDTSESLDWSLSGNEPAVNTVYFTKFFTNKQGSKWARQDPTAPFNSITNPMVDTDLGHDHYFILNPASPPGTHSAPAITLLSGVQKANTITLRIKGVEIDVIREPIVRRASLTTADLLANKYVNSAAPVTIVDSTTTYTYGTDFIIGYRAGQILWFVDDGFGNNLLSGNRPADNSTYYVTYQFFPVELMTATLNRIKPAHIRLQIAFYDKYDNLLVPLAAQYDISSFDQVTSLFA